MPGPVFGHIPGFPVGSRFENRAELAEAGLHRHRQAGISGSANKGADSIALSGGYEDHGDVIVYTGYGGRDPDTKRQVADQPFAVWNMALARSGLDGLTVRVIRGEGHNSPFSPDFGYRYDGLYYVEDYWHDIGRSGYLIWRYRLTKVHDPTHGTDESDLEQSPVEEPGEITPAPRREGRVLRVVRDTRQARQIKELYEYRCQMCGTRLEGLAGPYAEAAHVRPPGRPHNGPDTRDNLICLCPNHHVLFDHGGIAVAEDLSLIGAQGRLTVHPRHRVSEEHLRYPREHYRVDA